MAWCRRRGREQRDVGGPQAFGWKIDLVQWCSGERKTIESGVCARSPLLERWLPLKSQWSFGLRLQKCLAVCDRTGASLECLGSISRRGKMSIMMITIGSAPALGPMLGSQNQYFHVVRRLWPSSSSSSFVFGQVQARVEARKHIRVIPPRAIGIGAQLRQIMRGEISGVASRGPTS